MSMVIICKGSVCEWVVKRLLVKTLQGIEYAVVARNNSRIKNVKAIKVGL